MGSLHCFGAALPLTAARVLGPMACPPAIVPPTHLHVHKARDVLGQEVSLQRQEGGQVRPHVSREHKATEASTIQAAGPLWTVHMRACIICPCAPEGPGAHHGVEGAGGVQEVHCRGLANRGWVVHALASPSSRHSLVGHAGPSPAQLSWSIPPAVHNRQNSQSMQPTDQAVLCCAVPCCAHRTGR